MEQGKIIASINIAGKLCEIQRCAYNADNPENELFFLLARQCHSRKVRLRDTAQIILSKNNRRINEWPLLVIVIDY